MSRTTGRLRSWLMGFGSGVHVVEPKHLADAIGQELRGCCGPVSRLAHDNRLPTSRRKPPSKPVVRFVAAVLTILALTPINGLQRKPESKNHRGGGDCRRRQRRFESMASSRNAAGPRPPATGEFQQREPSEGAPATHPTDVRVLFDRDAIYVAVRAFDNGTGSHRRIAHAPRRLLAVRLGLRS